MLHESPDFDSVASAYLAVALLTTGEFPPGAEALARYADKIDEGSIGHTLSQPFSLYAAYMQLLNRHARLGRPADHAYWRDCVEQGLDLIAYALDRSLRDGWPYPRWTRSPAPICSTLTTAGTSWPTSIVTTASWTTRRPARGSSG